MRGSEFAALRAFVNVVDHKNFARAAEQLRISASTLSETIRELEGRIGVRLLNRTTRSVSMTDAGMRLYARFKPALGEMEAAVQDVANLRSRPAGTLRLHIPRLAAMTYLEPILGPFHRAYPDIVLDVTVDDAVTDIVAAGYDIGVRLGELLDNDVVAFKLSGDFREVAVASPDYVARHGRPDSPADLLHHSCINWRQPGRTELYKWEFYRDGRWCAVAVDGPLVVSHRDLALAAALQGGWHRVLGRVPRSCPHRRGQAGAVAGGLVRHLPRLASLLSQAALYAFDRARLRRLHAAVSRGAAGRPRCRPGHRARALILADTPWPAVLAAHH